jgi:subtilisin family serine protease
MRQNSVRLVWGRSKTWFFSAVLSFGFVSVQAKADAKVDPALVTFSQSTQARPMIQVIALMRNDSQGFAGPRRYDAAGVRVFLSKRAKAAWDQVAQELDRREVADSDLQLKSVHWIANAITVRVTPRGLKALSQLPMIEKIYADRAPTYMKALQSRPVVSRSHFNSEPKTLPYNLVDMKLDKVFEQAPEVTGKGVVVGHIDTGVDGKHPALAGKIKLFWNSSTQKAGGPATDSGDHGTHTAGTIVGGDRKQSIFGVAPEAQLISAGALSGYDAMLKAMEFMMDPDGNPATNDFPKLVNNSWNVEGVPDVEVFYRAISAWEAAGILPVFSAGNMGPGAATITKPHEHPGVIAVGATNEAGLIAKFSSRGPATYQGKPIQKPDMTAPGVNIVSTVPRGGMASKNGTSMAAPHVAGLVTLINQINPNLNPAQIREVLMKSLMWVNADGSPAPTQAWNANYGFGRVDGYAALKLAAGMSEKFRRVFLGSLASSQFTGSVFDRVASLESRPHLALGTSDLTSSYAGDESGWVYLD